MKILLLLIIVYTNISIANVLPIVSQGNVIVDFNDVDGFALKIPHEKRAGFFESINRTDQALTSILTMKHVVKYAKEKNLLDMKVINNLVYNKITSFYSDNPETTSRSMKEEIEYGKLKNFIELEISYKQVMQNIKNSIDIESLAELAHENYLFNKSDYVVPASKTIDYISIIYTPNNKKEQYEVAEKILLEVKDIDFVKYIEESTLQENVNIETKINLKNMYYTEQYKEFSNFIFNDNIDKGLIQKIFDNNSRFTIVNIAKSYPIVPLNYDDVKQKIISKLVNEKADSHFSDLILQLTQDSIEVNKEAFKSIKNRYIPSI